MDQCLAGPLLKGRTVILVTHNVTLASSVADYMVTLKPDGTVLTRGPVENHLQLERTYTPSTSSETHKVDGSGDEDEEAKLQKGKQIIAEEIAVGRIGWPVCKDHLFL